MPSEPAPLGAIQELTLANGLRVVYAPMPWLPTLSAALSLPFGSATDPEGREGSANVLHEWLQRGAGAMGSREYSDALLDLGARRGGGSGREASSLSLAFLGEVTGPALELLAAAVREPRLADAEFEPSRELALQELHSLQDAPTQRLFEALQERLFAGPQRRSAYGTAEGLAALDPAGVRADAAARLGPDGAVLGLAGGGDWERLAAAAERAFGGWRGASVAVPAAEFAPVGRHHVDADSSQVQIGLGFPSPAPGTDDMYVYLVALEVLSGSMGARLFTEVREKRGLVYSVSAFYRALRGCGYTLGYAGTTTERAGETLEVYLAELKRLAAGVSADEFDRARTGLLSNVVMAGESTGGTAGRLANDVALFGRPRTLAEIAERIEGVTLEGVNDYLAANPIPEPTVVTLGPKA